MPKTIRYYKSTYSIWIQGKPITKFEFYSIIISVKQSYSNSFIFHHFKVILRKERTETGIQNKTESGQKWTEVDRREQISELKTIDDKILYLIKQNPNITQMKMCELIGVGRTAITNHIRKMKDTNIIERVGSDRNGYWKIL